MEGSALPGSQKAAQVAVVVCVNVDYALESNTSSLRQHVARKHGSQLAVAPSCPRDDSMAGVEGSSKEYCRT
jgi:hypothetical protein